MSQTRRRLPRHADVAALLLVLVFACPAAPEGIDEAKWLFDVSLLEPTQRAARVKQAVQTLSRDNCGLLLGAFLSDDEEARAFLPGIQRAIHVLLEPADEAFLSERLAKADKPSVQDWLVDCLGFCGANGFVRLKELREKSPEPRIRAGALRAMANLLLPEAIPCVAQVVATATDPAEREAGRFAEHRLRWQTGNLAKEPASRAGRPLVQLNAGEATIRDALQRGGTLLVSHADVAKSVPDVLTRLGVVPPAMGEPAGGQACVFAPEHFHPVVAYPFDFFCADVAMSSFADYSWGKWSAGQLAPLRLQERRERAVLVIQEAVLGQGRVIFSALTVRSASTAARLGIPERDPWDENLEWFHADREVSGHLAVWQAREDFASRHIPWAKPFVGGPIRMVFVTPDYNGRDVVELAQRLEMTYEHLPFSWAGQKGFAHGIQVGRVTPPCWEVIERVAASPRDVILLAGRPLPGKADTRTFSHLSKDYQETLLRLVRHKGMGLVIVGEDAPFTSIGPEGQPEALSTPLAKFRRGLFGQGRIVCFDRGRYRGPDYDMPGAFRPGPSVEMYDHWAQDVVAQIAWAARRERPVQIAAPELRDASLNVPVQNLTGQPADGVLELLLRDRSDRIAARGTAKVSLAPQAKTAVPVPLDGLYPGSFFAEVILRDSQRRSLGWGSFPVRRKGDVEITNLEFDRPMYQPGEEMAVTLVLAGQPTAGTQAEIQVMDRYGRLCGRSESPVTPDALQARLVVGRPLWRYVTVQASLRHQDRLLTRFERPWIVDVPPPPKDFPYAAWSMLHLYPDLLDATQLAGIDWLNQDFESCLRHGVFPWIIGFGGLGLGEHAHAMNYERNPCPNGPTFHQWRLNEIPPKIQDIRRAGVPAIIDQDEEGLGGEYGFHPADLHEFRKHLKVEHGSLEELNRVWQTSYTKWSDAMPLRLGQLDGRASLAPMAELRMFMDTAYLHHVEFDRFVAESHGIPDVKLGLSTSGGGFSDGWDLWKAAKILTCMIRQHTGDREKYSSWRRPDMVLGRWAGGYYPDCVTTGRFMPWHQLFHGSTVYATWCSGIGNDMSIWRADGGMRDGIAASATELREIWSGPATLIRNSQRVPPLVGIHYSRASQMASAAEWWGATWGAADALEAGLEVLGHQFRYISYEEVEQGFCDTWPGKCIYLPVSICLSRAEVDALRRFAEQGGTLIADCDGGTRDAYGGVAGPGQLADVLGCEWVPAPALAKGQKLAITLNVPGVPQELPLDQGYRRIATLTTGKPQGTIHYGDQEFPAWIVHPFGRGQAITLNFLPARTAQGWAILRALLAAAGVKHPIDVTRDGKEILYVERFGFEDSGALYSAIMDFVKLRDGWGRLYLSPEERQPIPGVAVTFPRKAHLYDVRTKKYHGEADSLSSELEPAKAYLFAHLPYKVDGLAVDFPGTTSVTSGGRVSFQVAHAGGTSVPHSIRLQVFDPSGRERPEYGRVTRFPEGKGELEVPLAPNDPTGVWKVVASETISGISVEKPWEVKP